MCVPIVKDMPCKCYRGRIDVECRQKDDYSKEQSN
jgi:hypothetical protein